MWGQKVYFVAGILRRSRANAKLLFHAGTRFFEGFNHGKHGTTRMKVAGTPSPLRFACGPLPLDKRESFFVLRGGRQVLFASCLLFLKGSRLFRAVASFMSLGIDSGSKDKAFGEKTESPVFFHGRAQNPPEGGKDVS